MNTIKESGIGVSKNKRRGRCCAAKEETLVLLPYDMTAGSYPPLVGPPAELIGDLRHSGQQGLFFGGEDADPGEILFREKFLVVSHELGNDPHRGMPRKCFSRRAVHLLPLDKNIRTSKNRGD